jgi:hypothetical protein
VKKIIDFFSLIRWLNLLILLLTQLLAAWCLSDYQHISHFISTRFFDVAKRYAAYCCSRLHTE